MIHLNSKQQKKTLLIINQLDYFFESLFLKIKEKIVSDEVFSNLSDTKNLINLILEDIKKLGVKITYNNLTNCNYHTLVKILNYQNYFKGLPKETKKELKKLKLLI